MSKMSVEKVVAQEAGLKKSLAAMADQTGVERRAIAKKLRRTQRRRRALAASAAKNAPKKAAAESES